MINLRQRFGSCVLSRLQLGGFGSFKGVDLDGGECNREQVRLGKLGFVLIFILSRYFHGANY